MHVHHCSTTYPFLLQYSFPHPFPTYKPTHWSTTSWPKCPIHLPTGQLTHYHLAHWPTDCLEKPPLQTSGIYKSSLAKRYHHLTPLVMVTTTPPVVEWYKQPLPAKRRPNNNHCICRLEWWFGVGVWYSAEGVMILKWNVSNLDGTVFWPFNTN